MARSRGIGIFLSQTGAGWLIHKGLRRGVGLGPSRSRSPFPPLPSELRVDPLRAPERVGRNQPCPCGSGKKFKKCCGSL
jgi:hypothetical protein